MVGCAAVACKNNSSFKTRNGAESLKAFTAFIAFLEIQS